MGSITGKMTYLQNTRIYTPDKVIESGTIAIQGGKIVAVHDAGFTPELDSGDCIDGTGLSAIPGLIDLQLNGGFGKDFTQDPSTIWSVAAEIPKFGTTSFLPTVITSPLENMAKAQEVVCRGRPDEFAGAEPIGLHLEGPFLNPAKKGAHNPNHLRKPIIESVESWSPNSGVRLVTLAPELPGALDVIPFLVNRGVIVSAGHSTATVREAVAGFDAGIQYGTHLFNAMPPLHHREPGLAGALLARESTLVGLIPDGIHVHPTLVQTVWNALGSSRLSLVTDSMAAMGMAPGIYDLGDFQVKVDKTSARLADSPDTLAGAIITSDAALRNFITIAGCSLEEALPTMTSNPARLLGIDNKKGSIESGYDADIVLLNRNLEVAMTLVGGKVVFDNLDTRAFLI